MGWNDRRGLLTDEDYERYLDALGAKVLSDEDENPNYGRGNPDWERDFEKTREP